MTFPTIHFESGRRYISFDEQGIITDRNGTYYRLTSVLAIKKK